MNLSGNFSNLHRILRAPDAGISGGGIAEDNEAMAGALAVLNQRGLGMELAEPTPQEKKAGERKSKEQTKVDEWKDEDEEEEDQDKARIKAAEGKAAQAKADAEKRVKGESGKGKGEGKTGTEDEDENEDENAEGPTEAEIAEATKEWQEKIAELEGKIAEGDEDGKLAQELETAKENLQAWEEAGAQPAEGQSLTGKTPNEKEIIKAELAKVQVEKEQLEARVKELEADKTPGLSVENIHPLMFTEKPEEIEQMDQELAAFEKWALTNWDGTEERTVEKDGKEVVVQRGFSKEQIRSRYGEISEARRQLIPLARQHLTRQQQARAQAKTVYPELFDPKRTEAKAAENILRAVPALKAMFPNIWVIIGDALVGERLRLSKAAAAGKKNGAATAGNGTRRPLPRVARGGGAGATAGAGGVGAREAKRKLVRANGGIDPEKFMEAGGDRKALIASIS